MNFLCHVQVKMYHAVLFKNMFQTDKVNHVRKMEHYEEKVKFIFLLFFLCET
jgi:hypothetical protein